MRASVSFRKISFIVLGIIIFSAVSLFSQEVTTITLNWTAPGDDGEIGTAATYDIRYSTSPINAINWVSAVQVQNEPAPSPAGTVESFTVTGLNPNTTYYFAIKTADEAGNWSGLSNIAVAVTIDEMAPAGITDLDAEPGEEEGDLKLSWTASGDDGTLGTADSYQIYYSEDSITESNWQTMPTWPDPPQPLPAGQVQEFTLTGLKPAGIYWVAIVSLDDAANVSDLSNIVKDTAKFDLATEADDQLPQDFRLEQNFPNPFNPETVIEYSLSSDEFVELSVYNVLGQRIATLVNSQKPAGKHFARWDGSNETGTQVSSGLYLYVIKIRDYVEKKKMVLLK
ncbi:MAG TPA: T9SS type A sorting domain-containing protein [candidate division Zixibacteria bacterium]|nr:T9SS type A sorting domain-containing protein [candidate division Zixibacteria bacterium]